MRFENRYQGNGVDSPHTTYVWNREAMKLHPEDPNSTSPLYAAKTHFLVDLTGQQLALPLWTENALDDRTWYIYDGATDSSSFPHTNDWRATPDSVVGTPKQIITVPRGTRGIEDVAHLQEWTIDHGSNPKVNSFGLPQEVTDPLLTEDPNNPGTFIHSRDFVKAYDINGIDMLSVKQNQTGEYLGQWTYNAAHQPLTHIDGAGSTTSRQYNPQGQVAKVIDALASENTTTISYSGKAVLLGGTVVAGDTKVISLTVTNSLLPLGSKTVNFNMSSQTTLSDIAAALAAVVNNDGLLNTAGIRASWIQSYPSTALPAVYVSSAGNVDTTYNITTSGVGAETATLETNTTCGYLNTIDGPLSGSADITRLVHDVVGRTYRSILLFNVSLIVFPISARSGECYSSCVAPCHHFVLSETPCRCRNQFL